MNTLWEEKNSIEAPKKFENCTENTKEIFTNETKIVSKKSVCKDTGVTRKCPKCDCLLIYPNFYAKRRAEKKKTRCKYCAGKESQKNLTASQTSKQKEKSSIWNKLTFTGKSVSAETRVKISNSNKGRRLRPVNYVYTNEHRSKIRNSRIGMIFSKSTREKMRRNMIGKKFSDSTKENIEKDE